jgi:tetratricopeptide (TPR) repeat protein
MFTACCRILAAVVALSIGTAGEAAWQRASSAHFVIYADENPADLAAFASKLEKFDKAVRVVRKMDDPPVGDGNRLTVFVVRSDADVQKLIHDSSGFVRGFYLPRASGSVAFVPRRSGSGSQWDLDADTVFFHEYSHHLMMQELDSPAPPWLVEGFAEFMSTARFDKDGAVGLGIEPKHRAYSLILGTKMPIERMLAGSMPPRSTEEHESLYARGWLLCHYLTFEPSRQGQLEKYLDGIAKGVDPLQSARAAFGDLKQLDRELDKYLERRKLKYVRVDGSLLKPGPIDVQPLSPGAAAVLPLRIQSKRGVNSATAEPLAAQVRAVEARYPGDELVELTLAEAEFDAGHPDAAEAAADRALKANPRDTKALVFKGRAIARRAQALSGEARHTAFGQAREMFIAANKMDTEDPEPLMNYYRSYMMEGIQPTTNAVAALHYASDLAPQDRGLRMNSAARYLADGNFAQAKRALAPIAYDPHGTELAGIARVMIDKINAGDGKAALQASAGAPAAETSRN